MNRSEIIMEVSKRSGVGVENCDKVLDAFEKVLSEELSNMPSAVGALDKVTQLLSFMRKKK